MIKNIIITVLLSAVMYQYFIIREVSSNFYKVSAGALTATYGYIACEEKAGKDMSELKSMADSLRDRLVKGLKDK